MINLTLAAFDTLLGEDDQARIKAELADVRAGRDLSRRVNPNVAAVAQMMPMLGARRG